MTFKEESIDKEDREILNIVAFCLLMQHNNGILSKSPRYIREKFDRYCGDRADKDVWRWGLSIIPQSKFWQWVGAWMHGKVKKPEEI